MASSSSHKMAFCSATGNSSTRKGKGQSSKAVPKQRKEKERDARPLPNFGMTRSELFRELCKLGLMCPKPGKAYNAPLPPWYKPGYFCEYHMNTQGHSIDTCDVFRWHVLSLIDAGRLEVLPFEGEPFQETLVLEPEPEKETKQLEEEIQRLKGEIAELNNAKRVSDLEAEVYRLKYMESQAQVQRLQERMAEMRTFEDLVADLQIAKEQSK